MRYRGSSKKKLGLRRKEVKKGREKMDREAFDGIIYPRPLERAFVFPRLLSNRGRNDICRPLGKEIFLRFVLEAAFRRRDILQFWKDFDDPISLFFFPSLIFSR